MYYARQKHPKSSLESSEIDLESVGMLFAKTGKREKKKLQDVYVQLFLKID